MKLGAALLNRRFSALSVISTLIATVAVVYVNVAYWRGNPFEGGYGVPLLYYVRSDYSIDGESWWTFHPLLFVVDVIVAMAVVVFAGFATERVATKIRTRPN